MARRGVDGVREQTGSVPLDRMQSLAIELAAFLKRVPFLIGKAKRVRLVAGVPKTVNHRLGVPASFFVIRGNHDGGAEALVSESPDSAQERLDQKSQLSVIADADCIVVLWFYPRLRLEEE